MRLASSLLKTTGRKSFLSCKLINPDMSRVRWYSAIAAITGLVASSSTGFGSINRRCCQDYGQVFSTPQGAATPKNFQNPDFSLKWRDFWVFL